MHRFLWLAMYYSTLVLRPLKYCSPSHWKEMEVFDFNSVNLLPPAELSVLQILLLCLIRADIL